jgi:putative ubiquitin-RnfH superfamily antitoxin RatB of RatAB toxin-antitoxin module
MLVLPPAATVGDALAAARDLWLRDAAAQAAGTTLDWDAAVGIYGEACGRERLVEDGDRIELYRPLAVDPKDSRRMRARETRRRGS